MITPPAWIAAWERGFAAGEAAREDGDDTAWTHDLAAALPSLSAYFQGYSDGFDPDRAISAPSGSLVAFALVETVVGAVVTARGGRFAGDLFAWLVLSRLRDVAVPARLSTRAATPPQRADGIGFATAWQWGRRRAFGHAANPWTTIGMTLPLVFDREHRRRRDQAAWRAYRATRPAA